MQDIIKKAEKAFIKEDRPEFSPGDTVNVSMSIREGDKVRTQSFQGTVVQRRGSGLGRTFTVRKASGGVYVEKIFPFHSPLITEIMVTRKGRVRRAKLYYLRDRIGKATRVAEKQ